MMSDMHKHNVGRAALQPNNADGTLWRLLSAGAHLHTTRMTHISLKLILSGTIISFWNSRSSPQCSSSTLNAHVNFIVSLRSP